MNKRGLVILICLILTAQLTIKAYAQEPAELVDDPLAKKILENQDKIQNFTEQEDKEAYLAQEWTKLIQNNRAVNWIYKLNPIFKFLFGYEFSLSWAFVTALIIWAGLVLIFNVMLKTVFQERYFSLSISVIIAAIVSQISVRPIVGEISRYVKNIWGSLGAILILIIILSLFLALATQIKNIILKLREKRRILKLEAEAERSKAMREGFESMKKGADSMRRGSQRK